MSTVAPPLAGPPSARRRSRLLLAGVVIALALYACFGFFIAPRIIRGQMLRASSEMLHREATVGEVRVNPFTLAVEITSLRVSDRDGAALLAFDRIYLNAELSGIVRRAFRFKEIRIERPVVSARIMTDGKPSIADLIQPEAGAPAATASREQPLDLPRVIIDRLLVTSGVVQFSDASRQAPYASRFEPLNLDVSDLITIPREGGEHALTIGVGNGAQLHWTGRQTVEPLEFSGRLDVTGVDLPGLWDYFAAGQPLAVREGRVDLVLPYKVRRGTSSAFEITLNDASVRLSALVMRPHDENADWLQLAEARVSGITGTWPRAHAEVGSVTLTRPRVLARMDADGTWNWQHAFTLTGGRATTSDPPPWTYRIGAIDVSGGTARVEAAAVQDSTVVDVAGVTVHATNVTSDLTVPVAFTSQARVQAHGTLQMSGTIAPSPLAFDVAATAAAIELPPLQPYMALPTGTRLAAGTASFEGRVSMDASTQKTNASANGSLDGLELRDSAGDRFAAWRRMAIDRFTLDGPPNRARVRTITFDRSYAKLQIDKEGNLNLTRLLAGSTAPAPGVSGTTRAPAAAAAGTVRTANASAGWAPTVEIGAIVLRDAAADFSDASLPLPFTTSIHSASGTIRDLSTFAAAPATVAIEGRVDQSGYVKVGGTLRTSDPMAASEITMGFRSLDMAGLTPYFAEFAGYAIKRGLLDLDVRYQVRNRRLVGNHSVVARDLTVGDRVKDSKGPGFAVRLAIALLKDREGRINLDVPIEGTVDSPEFAYRKVFWSAMRTILGNAAKAPFRAMGRLFGRDEEDLELVEFDPGRSDLLPADQDMLARMAEQLSPRGELSLAVEGRFDTNIDTPALQRARLDRLIESRRPAAAAAAAPPGRSALETILETLFVERFSADALQAQRRRHSAPSDPAAPPPATPDTAPPPASLDAAGFYESLRAQLLEAQTVSDDDLRQLATARAAAIVAALTQGGTLEPSRFTVAAPSAAKRGRKDSGRIASEMTINAGDGNLD